jgi:predicted AlkP superfamily phosphohydrolase/phosphomutase
MAKTIVFGIDGGSLDILRPMAEMGHLPNMAAMLDKGMSGPLQSTVPPITAAAWTSFATGCHPGKHGLVDFVAPDIPDYRSRILNSTHRLKKTFWQILGEAGMTSGVIGVPMTYPPESHAGYLITGMMTPSTADRFTSPPSLRQELERELGPFPIHPGEGVMPSQTERYLQRIKEDMRQRARWALHLLEKQPTDFFMYVFSATDPLQHQFFEVIAEGLKGEREDRERGLFPMILSVYSLMDELMGRMLEAAGGKPLVMVMSDHGFGPLEGFFHVNTWLMQEGYMVLQKGAASTFKRWLFNRGLTPENIHLTLLRMGVDLRRRVNKGRSYQRLRRFFLSFDDVDWSRTSAFSMGHVGQIYINRKSLYRQGLVEDGPPCHEVREKLKKDLLSLKNAQTGEPVVGEVYDREAIYPGNGLGPAPDILFLPSGLKIMSFGETEFASRKIIGDSLGHTGHHRLEGAIIACGTGVPQGTITGAEILDLAPTILYHLGLGIPSDMDGRILEEIFPPERMTSDPPRAVSPEHDLPEPKAGYSQEEEEMIRERLKDLGYMA